MVQGVRVDIPIGWKAIEIQAPEPVGMQGRSNALWNAGTGRGIGTSSSVPKPQLLRL